MRRSLWCLGSAAGLLATLCLGVVSPAGAAPAAAPPASGSPLVLGYQGDAFGTSVNVGRVVSSGPTALAVIGCGTNDHANITNDVASVTLPVLATGAVTSHLATTADSSSASSTIASVNIGDGLITATSITARSVTTAASPGYTTSGSSSLVDLVIAGTPITVSASPNTKIAIPGVGTVTLNEQKSTVKSNFATETVNAIDLRVTIANSLGLPLGARIIVGHAMSGLVGPTSGLLGGAAFGSSLTGDPALTLGRTAFLPMPCQGTGGAVKTNSTAAVSTPPISLGVTTSTAQGTVGATSATAKLSNTTADVSLLNGPTGPLVSASAITAEATATRSRERSPPPTPARSSSASRSPGSRS